MENKELELYRGEMLTNALKRELTDASKREGREVREEELKFIPSNVVLDKTLTGIGATYTEIHAKRNSIIIEPNVPVIKGKVKKHQKLNLLGVYDGVTQKHIEKYLSNSSIKCKKLLTTPEGFNKIKTAAEGLGINLHADFFCLFDECERITQDVAYRSNITNPVKDFFEFDAKAFVSATPLDIHHSEFDKQGFQRLKIVPQFDYKKDIQLIVTNDVVNVLQEKLEELKHSQCICIFYNSTKGIDSIVHSLGMQYNYKTFCSEDSAKKLKELGFENVETEFSLPFAQYNFFTSRFFSAVDIELKVKPDIIIYTDLKQAEFTIIDPYSEAIQIQGRFRKVFEDGKSYNSLTHITNFKGEMSVKTVEELDKEIKFYRSHHTYLLEQQRETNSAVVSKAISKDIRNIAYSRLLSKDGSIDEFAIHNLYNEERVRGYYKSIDTLKEAYENTGFFNVDYRKDLRFNLEDARFSIRQAESKKKKIIRLVLLLHDAPNPEELGKAVSSDFEEASLIVDAYIKLGEEYILSVNHSLTKIKRKLVEFDSNKKRFCPEILLEISDTFELGVKQSKNYYKEKLEEIYSRYGIVQKVTQETITDYFGASPNNSEKPATFTLKEFKGVAGN